MLTNVATQTDSTLSSVSANVAIQTDATLSFVHATTQTDPTLTSNFVSTSVFAAPRVSDVANQTDAEPVHAATPIVPVQTFDHVAATSATAHNAPPMEPGSTAIRLDSVQTSVATQTEVVVHEVAVESDFTENLGHATPTAAAATSTSTTTSNDAMSASTDTSHAVNSLIPLRFHLLRLRCLSISTDCLTLRRAKLCTFALRFTGRTSLLILWEGSVIIILIILGIVEWSLLSSRGVYYESIGWPNFHQIRPAVEGFNEHRWSVGYIAMDRWRRFWYGYWEKRALARLAHRSG